MFPRLFIIPFLLLVFSLPAQKTGPAISPYASADKLIQKHNAGFTTLDSLSGFIVRHFRRDEEKARAIFYWITSNISYATDLMYTYQYEPDNSRLAQLSFESRKAVCSGYAALADTLFRMTGMESVIVPGSTRQTFFPTVIGHAWNAVKCDGQWKLMDVTWGSGYLNGRNFVRRREEKYFLAVPVRLGKTHLPFDPVWQMSVQPLNMELAGFHRRLYSFIRIAADQRPAEETKVVGHRE
jgi:transglutaminase/protease-like cytokinesis protein 3